MNTFKVFGDKPYEHIIKANTIQEAIDAINKEYPKFNANSAVQTNTPTYQLHYDMEHFDNNGRRKF